ncbi:hypothetical protein [Marinibactrum halimedae]|uniref:Uncharacterized protein n=1 Tax=Marinibactrum halimedae TaxID=1444977 RepID=A0AA37T6A3_9GAMM|nr:hypothetical protein [Marinibactrum halimedae]MCD9458886.1 hypothetical protein [Marinibactrum halimedae]GLS27735.1 hypothetical protein GCM10007877_34540 [Marinibactrum halimedae]
MNTFSFEDLLKEPCLRTREASIEGFGRVTVHELSSADAAKITKEAQALIDDSEASKLHLAKSVVHILKGSPATKAEAEKLSKNLSTSMLNEIFNAAMHWRVDPLDIEKNS